MNVSPVKIKWSLSPVFKFQKQGLMLFLCFLFSLYVHAQKDTTKTNIIILNNEYSEYIQSDEGNVHKLIHHVKLLHGSDTLYCDSAFFYQNQNSVEAFGDVAIFQADGTEAFADYMRYTGSNKMVFMKGTHRDVQLSDVEGNSLWSKEVYYNLTSKLGTYRKGGTLQNDMTIVSSYTATYSLNNKNARFKGNVLVNDPEYQVSSEDLGYNTESKISTFLSPSIVTNEESILQTSKGTYNSIMKIGYFPSRSSILNKANYIEADTLDYDKTTGFGIAIGNVIAIDTVQKSTLYCGHAIYNEIHETLLAFDKPLMKSINEKGEFLFIKADTFYGQPIIIKEDSLTAQDSLQSTADMLRGSIINDDSVPQNEDSMAVSVNDSLFLDIENIDSLLQVQENEIPDSLNFTDYKIEESLSDTEKIVEIEFPDSISLNPEILSENNEEAEEQQENFSGIKTLKENLDLLVYASKRDTAKQQEIEDSTLVLERQGSLDSMTSNYQNRPSQDDTNKLRYFTAYPQVFIFSDSLQGKCDSLVYSQEDSLMRMYMDPLLWPNKSQISGDVIFLQLENNDLKELIVPKNAIMITRSGPEQAQFYDQIQGNTIKGYFKENNLDSLIAEPNAASIYYITDEDKAYVGASQATSERIEILFEDEEIKFIRYIKEVKQEMTPIQDVNPQSLRLSRFKWREQEKAKNLDAFLEDTSIPQEPQLIRLNFNENSKLIEDDEDLNDNIEKIEDTEDTEDTEDLYESE